MAFQFSLGLIPFLFYFFAYLTISSFFYSFHHCLLNTSYHAHARHWRIHRWRILSLPWWSSQFYGEMDMLHHMEELKWGSVHRVFAKQRRHGSAKASWRRGIAEQSLKGGGGGKPQPFERKKPQKFHKKKKNGRSWGENGGERRVSHTRPWFGGGHSPL